MQTKKIYAIFEFSFVVEHINNRDWITVVSEYFSANIIVSCAHSGTLTILLFWTLYTSINNMSVAPQRLWEYFFFFMLSMDGCAKDKRKKNTYCKLTLKQINETPNSIVVIWFYAIILYGFCVGRCIFWAWNLIGLVVVAAAATYQLQFWIMFTWPGTANAYAYA